jgi:hypothetical protein
MLTILRRAWSTNIPTLFIFFVLLFFVQATPVSALLSGNTDACCNYSSHFSDSLFSTVSGGNTIESVTVFSGGNSSWHVSGEDTSGSFAAMVGGTAHYSNGDGTYNTITVDMPQTDSNNDTGNTDDGGSYSQGSYASVGCPTGYTYNNNQCYPNSSCTQTTSGSGKGSNTITNCTTPSSNSGTQIVPAGTQVVPSTSSCVYHTETIPHGQSRDYIFYNESSVLYGQSCSSYTLTLSCTDGEITPNNYDTLYRSCAVEAAPPVGNISIRAIPPLVRYGESSTIVWDGANAEACTVTGYGLTNRSGITGNERVQNITGESIYVLTCTLGPNSRSESARLRILPQLQET